MPRLADKVAFVTGAAHGIGRAIALRFAAEGARLALMDILADEVLALRRDIGEEGCVVCPGDVSDEAAVADAIAAAAARFGRLDVLVNDAYAAVNQPIHRLGLEAWRHTLDVCLTGMFFTCRAAIPIMQRNGGGSIINMSSVQARFTVAGAPAYAAAKGAVLSLTRQLAVDYGPDGIRANAICPGFIATEALTAHILSDPAEARGVIDSTPLRRAGGVADIAAAAVFLASDEASFITGTDILVDGGVSAQWPMLLLRPKLREKARIGIPSEQSS